jgi:cation diffusion facilitator CzcD-associated flavoprotein CzcO
LSPVPRVAIIGAGLGGLALGAKLKRAGIDSFVIFEQSDGPGGTWWDNTYPGAACDVGSTLYSYSFMPYDWTGTHPTRDEILSYIKAVIERFGLGNHIRYRTRVTEAAWDHALQQYTVSIAGAEDEPFDVVVSAVGMLNVPRYPNWPGLEGFSGPKFHTARWEHEHDLTGRRVAVVGTGSTAAQVVPALAPTVGELFVFQREPGWILPKAEQVYSRDERARHRRFPFIQRYERAKLYIRFDRLRSAAEPTSAAQRQLREVCLQHIADSIEDPHLRAAVTPDHPVWCKRPILANDYYRALNRDNVHLVPHAVERVTPTGLIDAAGIARDVDVLVMATGFGAAQYLSTLSVKGRGGKGLHETWNGEPNAFLGLGLPGFPNFFMLYGPGTNGGSIIFKLERQAEWIVRVVQRMRRAKLGEVEIRPLAQRGFDRWYERANRTMAWQDGGCNNYFAGVTGRVVTQWPGSMTLYWLLTLVLGRVVTTSVPASSNGFARTPAVGSASEIPPQLIGDRE